jgi:hypothetical protein
MACCRVWSQLFHEAVELLCEDEFLDLRGGCYQELALEPQGLATDEFCCG